MLYWLQFLMDGGKSINHLNTVQQSEFLPVENSLVKWCTDNNLLVQKIREFSGFWKRRKTDISINHCPLWENLNPYQAIESILMENITSYIFKMWLFWIKTIASWLFFFFRFLASTLGKYHLKLIIESFVYILTIMLYKLSSVNIFDMICLISIFLSLRNWFSSFFTSHII